MKPKILREYTESLIVAVCLALVLRFFVVSAYKIPTGSMLPTLKVGDFIFAYKLPYGFPVPFSNGERWPQTTLPERGDVVVFRYPGNENVNYVKRVVGLPGDRIAIKNKKLLINDVEADYQPLASEIISDVPSSEMYAAFRENFGALSTGASHLIMNNQQKGDSFGPIVVPPGQFFVLGDNRDSSDDSRYWGAVPLSYLEGRVITVWLSLDWMNRWASDRFPQIRWERLFKKVE